MATVPPINDAILEDYLASLEDVQIDVDTIFDHNGEPIVSVAEHKTTRVKDTSPPPGSEAIHVEIYLKDPGPDEGTMVPDVKSQSLAQALVELQDAGVKVARLCDGFGKPIVDAAAARVLKTRPQAESPAPDEGVDVILDL